MNVVRTIRLGVDDIALARQTRAAAATEGIHVAFGAAGEVSKPQQRVEGAVPRPQRRALRRREVVAAVDEKKNQTQLKVGALDYDEKSRKGIFEGSVPEAEFELQVGAERDSKGAAPAGKVVFEKHIGG